MELEIEFEALHLAALAFSAVVILVADHEGWRYIRGLVPTLSLARVTWLHRLVWLGLAVMIGSGLLLVRNEPDVLEEAAFLVKMLMVLGLVVNGVFIGRLSEVATRVPFLDLTQRERLPIFVSGAISTACWVGAAVIGFFFL